MKETNARFAFANCMRHAFMTGAGYGDLERISDEDLKRWTEFDPPEVGSFVTMEKLFQSLSASPASVAAVDWVTNCCHCGRIIDTRETSEGGDDFGAEHDGKWTCSIECWDAVVDPAAAPTPPAPAQPAAEPVGYASEYGLTKLASKAHHYCLSVSKSRENEFVVPIYAATAHVATEERVALEKASAALKPLSDAVYNDNGDMTVSLPTVSAEECISAYFAEQRIRSALASETEGGCNE